MVRDEVLLTLFKMTRRILLIALVIDCLFALKVLLRRDLWMRCHRVTSDSCGRR